MEMPAKTVDKKNPDALKPSVYLWIPTNNRNVISVEYRNVPNAVNTAKLQTTEILKAYPTLVVADPLKVGKDATQATYSLTLKPEESKGATPATTAKPALAESFMKEDEHHTLSFLDKIKLKLAGVSEEKALENLNNGLPIDWTGSKEGYYDREESRGNYSGTNEGLEDMDKTDYDFNERMLNYEKEEEARKELGDELYGDNYSDLEVEIDESSSDSLLNKHGKNAKPHEMEESSSNSLINKKGKNAKPNVAYLKEGHEDVIQLQDNQANYVFTLLKQDGPDEAIEYLKEWHKPGTHRILSEVKKGVLDKSFEKDGYTMTWNPSVGYVKLSYNTKKQTY
jgi:hypothetical protein